MYYQAIDLVIAAINNRFNQADYDIYAKLEQVLLLAATNGNYSRELTEVTEFYKDDFNKSDLETQLEILSQMKIDCAGDSITFQDIYKHLRGLSLSHHALVSQVMRLVKFVLLMPATNAMSERSALAMRRIKTYLRTSMTQARLNHVMVLHIHKHLTDSISHAAVLNEFVSANEARKSHFGSF